MTKTTYFYNPETKTLSKVSGTWPEEVRRTQTEMLAGSGFGEVVGYEPPKSQMPFAIVSERFEAVGDGTFRQVLEETPLPVKLSQDKLLGHPAVQHRLNELMAGIANDPLLSGWWANDMRYLRGSDMAARAMEVLGLTQEQMEKLVLDCKA